MSEERHPDTPTVTLDRRSTATTGEAPEEEQGKTALLSPEHETTEMAKTGPQEENNEAHMPETTMDRHP